MRGALQLLRAVDRLLQSAHGVARLGRRREVSAQHVLAHVVDNAADPPGTTPISSRTPCAGLFIAADRAVVPTMHSSFITCQKTPRFPMCFEFVVRR